MTWTAKFFGQYKVKPDYVIEEKDITKLANRIAETIKTNKEMVYLAIIIQREDTK